eukprot:TRINITY_DN9732_c0_g1_i2.p1 TRINITY_DN9732_c0_g1~~TRINITY_DN9732_c0_g1_i2.p1  ORF type:complete len:101 (-),score=3.01 TRINITY_DN9732_c0_g1_i2:298-600(-)
MMKLNVALTYLGSSQRLVVAPVRRLGEQDRSNQSQIKVGKCEGWFVHTVRKLKHTSHLIGVVRINIELIGYKSEKVACWKSLFHWPIQGLIGARIWESLQ